MLISPPFLLVRNANETEDQWIDRCMPGGQPGDGAFPISFNLGWHGGLHLTAPANATGHEAVRVIADGTVVYRRAPTPQPAGPLPDDHALAYGGGWTDDGVVVIRHDTEIGEGPNASVRFFSIYMHLREIDARVSDVAGRNAIYRKDVIGQAGQINGALEPRIHFEIVCDDDNLRKLVGRAAGELPTGADGRADAVYGEMYFLLPAGTTLYGQRPLPQSVQAMVQPAAPRGQPRPPPQALLAVHTTAEPIVVGLRYAGGDLLVAGGGRGDAWITSYRPDGSLLGASVHERDADYDLYSRAAAISTAYPANARPAPSTVFELLRFGRVIGPDALNPADVPHWRQIRHDGNDLGWVNLNAAGVRKFSDADFPHWKRWTLVDDSADQDSRCDSATVRGWLDTSGDGQVEPAEATARLGDADVAPRLARTVCKMATEWDAATVERRWGWLRTASAENPRALSDEDFAALQAHIGALAFWPGGTGLPAQHWHFQPREFVRWFRACTWLSLNELTQLLPRRHGPSAARLAEISWARAQANFRPYALALNKAFRKYLIQSPERQTHFLAQTYIETAMWATMEEFGRAHQQRRRDGTLYWPAPAMQYYQAFYGRGIMQLTWAANYEAYGNYRQFADAGASHTYVDTRITHASLQYWSDPRDRTGRVVQTPRRWSPRFDPALISTDAYNACDSGAFYWVSKNVGGGAININRTADDGITQAAVGRASVLVNGGGYGFAERQAYAPFIQRFRGDGADTAANSSFNATYGRRVHAVYVDFTPQRPR